MDMIPGSHRIRGTNFFLFVGRIVVHNNMHTQLLRHIGINVAEKLQELLVVIPFLRLRKDPHSWQHPEQRKRQHSVADTITLINNFVSSKMSHCPWFFNGESREINWLTLFGHGFLSCRWIKQCEKSACKSRISELLEHVFGKAWKKWPRLGPHQTEVCKG